MAEVGCAGILVADIICGPLERLPHGGELLSVGPIPTKIGGCAANVAVDLAKQGVAVDICGCVGKDSYAEVVLQSMESAGVGCEQIHRVGTHDTSKTVILLVKGEDRRFLHNFGANSVFSVGHINREWLDGLKVFYLGGLCVMPSVKTDELVELLAYCRNRGITTVVDVVVPRGYSGFKEIVPLLPHIDYFLPNEDEAEQLTGRAEREMQLQTFLSHGARTVIITCGPDGSIAARGNDRWKAAAYPIDCIDPSGSGDAFDAGLIVSILRGWDLGQTLRYGAALGASATTAVGTTDGVFTAEQAQAFLEKHPLAVQKL
jgi:sugar/nucleoside kinase (ribokinase family)